MSFIQQNDITVFCETKISEYVTNDSLALPGYQIFRQDRKSNGGGIATFVNTNLCPIELLKLQKKYYNKGMEISIIKVKINKPFKFAIVVSVYRPPKTKYIWFEHFSALLVELRTLSCPIFALGDFNVDLMTPDTQLASHIFNCFSIANIKVPSIFPTRITKDSATCLDLIACPLELQVVDHFPVPNGSS